VAGLTFVGAGDVDVWVLKLNASGNVTWQKTYGSGGEIGDFAPTIEQTTDGGFVVAGHTSFGAGIYDLWGLKLDASGDATWQKTYGGAGMDGANSIRQTTDGGFVVAGEQTSFGGSGFWALKLDALGIVTWQKTYGGAIGGGAAYSIQQTPDGGFVVAGETGFGGGPGSRVLKLDANGEIDPSCTLIADTAVTGADTFIVPATTAVTGADTFVVPANTAVTGVDSAATVAEQCYGCTADAFEPDDNCIVSPAVIHGGETQSHNFCDNTEDWISFSACTGRSYTIETSNLGAACDTVLELYDADCTSLLLSDDNGGVGLASKIAGWVAPGDRTYHVKVLQFDATTGKDRDYDITLTGGTSPCSTWARSYDEGYEDEARSVTPTTDGGFIVAGRTYSLVPGNDVFVLKLDTVGNIQWQKTYGGTGPEYDEAYFIQQTLDGGYVMAGYTESFGAIFPDIWVLKLDSQGNIEWQRTYGGTVHDYAESIQQTSDGGFIVAGWTGSFGSGSWDSWVLKLDASGVVQWQKTYGGASPDYAYSIQQVSDGGYIVAGYTESFGAGKEDCWILKLDASGNVQWQKTYGSVDEDAASSIRETMDGGYIVAGYTYSFGAGSYDFWVLKLDALGAVQWQKVYDQSIYDFAESIQQTSEGGFVVGGNARPFGSSWWDYWILKLDGAGNIEWQKIYGGNDWDELHSVHQSADGGFIAAGRTGSFATIAYDFWLLKLGPTGDIDSSCTFVSDTTATVTDTTATITCTTVTPADTTATVTDPGATPVDSATAIEEQCSYVVCEFIPCEPSGSGGDFPLLLESDAGSPTGYYLYFQKILDATAYHLYEGTLGAWYDHGAGAVCDLAVGPALDDMGNGELRYAITPSAGDHYYLVTAHDTVVETVSGYDSAAVERDPLQSTCPP
jgi:uncharacterized delta-60 repeat protein